MTGKVRIVKRNGRTYVTYSDVSTICDAQNVQINVNYHNVPPLINGLVTKAVNSNWRMFKEILHSSFEKYAMDIVTKMVTPVIEEMACEDVYHMK